MENRERLRLLSLEMEMQRTWLASYLEDREARASELRRNIAWQVLMSALKARPLWVAAIGAAAQWWRRRQVAQAQAHARA
jgi:hypothetical protein